MSEATHNHLRRLLQDLETNATHLRRLHERTKDFHASTNRTQADLHNRRAAHHGSHSHAPHKKP